MFQNGAALFQNESTINEFQNGATTSQKEQIPKWGISRNKYYLPTVHSKPMDLNLVYLVIGKI